ncbi:MAG: DUF6763 family protein [Halieaceae bacterium]|jgi:hypothetical protein|nr:DUF6763 family protein [Halieaceae bacterium]
MSKHLPQIGHWYQDCDTNLVFEIVATDRDEGTVQVQYLGGEITDFDLESWAMMNLRAAAEPEDWRSAFELDADIAPDPDEAFHPLQWANPLSRIEPEAMVGIDDA